MEPYLVTGTTVLSDTIYTTYGGTFSVDESTALQRDIAYMMAEQQAIQEIGTFLVPTTITGSFGWPERTLRINMPYTHIRSIDGVTTIHEAGCNCATVELTGCAHIVNRQAGIVDLRDCGSLSAVSGNAACSCRNLEGAPFKVQVAFTAGLGAGVIAANPSALMGLTIAADLSLEQLIDPSGAEGGPGDPSLTSVSDTGYSASRQGLKMTAFGGSSRANYAARMLSPLKYKRALRLR